MFNEHAKNCGIEMIGEELFSFFFLSATSMRYNREYDKTGRQERCKKYEPAERGNEKHATNV